MVVHERERWLRVAGKLLSQYIFSLPIECICSLSRGFYITDAVADAHALAVIARTTGTRDAVVARWQDIRLRCIRGPRVRAGDGRGAARGEQSK